MIRVGLIGNPLTHSFSKRYFEEKFQRKHIHASFENLEIVQLDDIKNIITELGWVGYSVTIPHKVRILDHIDMLHSTAARIGAVNCVKTHVDGMWQGFNTDVIGFRDSLRPILDAHHTAALILGNGGASRAVRVALEDLDIPYLIVGRDQHADIQYTDITQSLMQAHPIIINTTPLGTYPYIDTLPPIPYRYITDRHLLYDLVYNPSITAFLQHGIDHQARTINGQSMLELQAAAAWDIWMQ